MFQFGLQHPEFSVPLGIILAVATPRIVQKIVAPLVGVSVLVAAGLHPNATVSIVTSAASFVANHPVITSLIAFGVVGIFLTPYVLFIGGAGLVVFFLFGGTPQQLLLKLFDPVLTPIERSWISFTKNNWLLAPFNTPEKVAGTIATSVKKAPAVQRLIDMDEDTANARRSKQPRQAPPSSSSSATSKTEESLVPSTSSTSNSNTMTQSTPSPTSGALQEQQKEAKTASDAGAEEEEPSQPNNTSANVPSPYNAMSRDEQPTNGNADDQSKKSSSKISECLPDLDGKIRLWKCGKIDGRTRTLN